REEPNRNGFARGDLNPGWRGGENAGGGHDARHRPPVLTQQAVIAPLPTFRHGQALAGTQSTHVRPAAGVSRAPRRGPSGWPAQEAGHDEIFWLSNKPHG